MIAAAALALSVVAFAPAEDFQPQIYKTTSSYTVRETVGPMETPLTPEWSDFLLDHPDLSAALVRAHHLAPYKITMLGPRRSLADDGEGTSGDISLVDKREGRRLYYGEGTHRSAFFPTIHAAAVIDMAMEPVEERGCPRRVRSAFTVYVRLRSRFLSGMVKALRPFVQKTVIRKFSKAFMVADQVGRLLAEKPEEVSREILSYPGLSPEDHAQAERLVAALRLSPAACLPRP